MEWFSNLSPDMQHFVTAFGAAMAFVVFVIWPLLAFLTWRISLHMKDMKENWTTVEIVPTERYAYQVHNVTGARRVTTLLTPKPKIDKDWLKGRSETLNSGGR